MIKEYIIKIDEDQSKKDIHGGYPLKEPPLELVRCKDCTYLSADTGICIVGIPHGYKDTFYCAYGKKAVKLDD